MADWWQILGGGVAGAVLNQWAQRFMSEWDKPVLKIDFDPGIEGCERPHIQDSDAVRKYLRVRVRNDGRTVAANVRVVVTTISGDFNFRDEVFDVGWSRVRRNAFRRPGEDVPLC